MSAHAYVCVRVSYVYVVRNGTGVRTYVRVRSYISLRRHGSLSLSLRGSRSPTRPRRSRSPTTKTVTPKQTHANVPHTMYRSTSFQRIVECYFSMSPIRGNPQHIEYVQDTNKASSCYAGKLTQSRSIVHNLLDSKPLPNTDNSGHTS